MPVALTGTMSADADLGRWERLPRLREMLAKVGVSNTFWQERLDGWTAPNNLEEYRKLPLTSNHDLSADQIRHPPFGSNLSEPLGSYSKYHQTSGTTGKPLLVLDTPQSWDWWCDCWDSVLDVCGLRDTTGLSSLSRRSSDSGPRTTRWLDEASFRSRAAARIPCAASNCCRTWNAPYYSQRQPTRCTWQRSPKSTAWTPQRPQFAA